MARRLIILGVVMVLAVAMLAAPAVAAGGAQGNGAAPPGLHNTPAMYKANPHSVCVRCHMEPTLPTCIGEGCHADPT
jgi:hypothetical protein